MSFDAALGASTQEIAAKYRLQVGTVQDYLQQASEFRFVEAYIASISEKLAPLAMAVYEQHLLSGNLEAARDILFGLGVLGSERESAASKDVESITLYRLERKLNGAASSPSSSNAIPVGRGSTINSSLASGTDQLGAATGESRGNGDGLLGAGDERSPAGLQQQGAEAGGWPLPGGGDEPARGATPIWTHLLGGDAAPAAGSGAPVEAGASAAEASAAPLVTTSRKPLPRVGGDSAPAIDLELERL